MEDLHRIALRRVKSQLNELLRQFSQIHLPPAPLPPAWKPAINAYRSRDAIMLCVDLAGVEKDTIELTVEPRRVQLRGWRELPQPKTGGAEIEQLLAMEIDHGAFERHLELPVNVVPEEVVAEHVNGLLWIHLPIEPGT